MKKYANPPPKHAAPRRKSRGGTLLGLFLGLVLGILIAFGVVWYLNKSPLPFLDKIQRADHNGNDKAGARGTPEPLPGKPGDKVGEKPRFEFYKILPGGQEATPAPTAPPPAPVAAPAETAPAAGEQYFLQAGAFQKPADADNLRAKLALVGIEATVQEAAVPDKGTMHRVRVGPFASPDDMNKARNQLAQNGIQATVIKIKN